MSFTLLSCRRFLNRAPLIAFLFGIAGPGFAQTGTVVDDDQSVQTEIVVTATRSPIAWAVSPITWR